MSLITVFAYGIVFNLPGNGKRIEFRTSQAAGVATNLVARTYNGSRWSSDVTLTTLPYN